MKQEISLLPAAAGISACLAAAVCLLTVCNTDRLMILSAGSLCFGVLAWIRSGSQAGQEPFTSGETTLSILAAGALFSAGSSLPAAFLAVLILLLLFLGLKRFMLKKNSKEHLVFGIIVNCAMLAGGFLLFSGELPIPTRLLTGIFCSRNLSGTAVFSISAVLCAAALLLSPYFSAAGRNSSETAELGISRTAWSAAGLSVQAILSAMTVFCCGLLAGPALLPLFFFGKKYSSASVPVFFAACCTFLIYTAAGLTGLRQEFLLFLIPAAYIETLTAAYLKRHH